jgi:thioredoxin 1
MKPMHIKPSLAPVSMRGSALGRDLFARLAAIAILLFAVILAGNAGAATLKPYSPEAVEAAQAKGQPIALHFHADWCPTCRAQQNVLRELEKAGDPKITIFVVDYDNQKKLRRAKNVRVQSTLIVYRGSRETGRLAGETGRAEIKTALQSALKP